MDSIYKRGVFPLDRGNTRITNMREIQQVLFGLIRSLIFNFYNNICLDEMVRDGIHLVREGEEIMGSPSSQTMNTDIGYIGF